MLALQAPARSPHLAFKNRNGRARRLPKPPLYPLQGYLQGVLCHLSCIIAARLLVTRGLGPVLATPARLPHLLCNEEALPVRASTPHVRADSVQAPDPPGRPHRCPTLPHPARRSRRCARSGHRAGPRCEGSPRALLLRPLQFPSPTLVRVRRIGHPHLCNAKPVKSLGNT